MNLLLTKLEGARLWPEGLIIKLSLREHPHVVLSAMTDRAGKWQDLDLILVVIWFLEERKSGRAKD